MDLRDIEFSLQHPLSPSISEDVHPEQCTLLLPSTPPDPAPMGSVVVTPTLSLWPAVPGTQWSCSRVCWKGPRRRCPLSLGLEAGPGPLWTKWCRMLEKSMETALCPASSVCCPWGCHASLRSSVSEGGQLTSPQDGHAPRPAGASSCPLSVCP